MYIYMGTQHVKFMSLYLLYTFRGNPCYGLGGFPMSSIVMCFIASV